KLSPRSTAGAGPRARDASPTLRRCRSGKGGWIEGSITPISAPGSPSCEKHSDPDYCCGLAADSRPFGSRSRAAQKPEGFFESRCDLPDATHQKALILRFRYHTTEWPWFRSKIGDGFSARSS